MQIFDLQKSYILERIAAKLSYKKSAETAEILARATGLEPVTYGLTVRCSTD